MKSRKIIVSTLLIALIFGIALVNVFAANVNLEEKIEKAKQKVEQLTEDLKKQKDEVIKKEEEDNKAKEEYAKVSEEAAVINKEEIDNKFAEAEKELNKQKEILAKAEARLAKVQDEIKKGEEAVMRAQENPDDEAAQKAAAEAWAKNDEWAEEETAAQKALNTIKTDNYLEDAQKSYDKIKSEKNNSDSILQRLAAATKKAQETNEALNNAAKKRSDIKEALEDAINNLDNLNSEKDDNKVTTEPNEEEPVEGNENDGYATEAEAIVAAEKALENDSINNSYTIAQGSNGRYYYILSPVEKGNDTNPENNEKEIIEGNENDGYATEEEAKAAAEKALENDKINKSYTIAMSANGRYYYVLSPVEKEKAPETKENEEVVEKANYTLLYQPDFVWVRNGKNEKMFFKSSAPFDKFVGVKVDGNFIDAKNYIAKEGSTEITLKEEYLKTLEDGKHVLTIASTDGEVNANFEITTAKAEVANTPATGSAIMIQSIAFVISLIGLGATVKIKK